MFLLLQDRLGNLSWTSDAWDNSLDCLFHSLWRKLRSCDGKCHAELNCSSPYYLATWSNSKKRFRQGNRGFDWLRYVPSLRCSLYPWCFFCCLWGPWIRIHRPSLCLFGYFCLLCFPWICSSLFVAQETKIWWISKYEPCRSLIFNVYKVNNYSCMK